MSWIERITVNGGLRIQKRAGRGLFQRVSYGGPNEKYENTAHNNSYGLSDFVSELR